MKSYEQMTKDVLKRRDEKLKSSMKFKRAAELAVPCASMAAIVGIVCGVSTYADRKQGLEQGLSGSQPAEMVSSADPEHNSGYNSSASGAADTATSVPPLEILPVDPEKPDYTNPKSGQNDIHVLDVGKFNSDSGVETDPADFDPYTMESLCRFYGLEFDRLTKLHSSWGLQHEPLGIYKRQSSDGFSVSMEMYGTRNTLNYTTEKGAKISVSAQYLKFAPLSKELFAEDKPYKPITPKVVDIYDDNGNLIGQASPSYSPAKDPNRPVNDEGVSLVNGYDAYIYRDSNGNFAADINMASRVRFIATGLSEEEFLEVLDEYTK